MSICGNCGEENAPGAVFCLHCDAPLEAPTAATRKVVTALFTDVRDYTGLSERLDAELLREIMGRFFQAAHAIIRRHGGIVTNFAGDALVAFFGVPAAHEDDAWRAVRAAVELREALARLNRQLGAAHGEELTLRVGVNTGEVVVGDPSVREGFATGTAIIVAKRLEEAAGAGEILIGRDTYRLVKDAVSAEPVHDVGLKGVSAPVTAFRVSDAIPTRQRRGARRLDTPLVGRDRELRLLGEAFDLAVAQRTCHLFTVLGPAGIGKTRLVMGFLDRVGSSATVLRGSCPSYGERITFWPLAEALRKVTLPETDESPDAAVASITEALAHEPRAAEAAAHIAELIGLVEPTTPAGEGFWAVRLLLEALARERPLILVLDDLHWAKRLLVDLVEDLARWAQGAPILIVCIARQEFLQSHPTWGRGLADAAVVTLEPLPGSAADAMLAELVRPRTVPEQARERIKDAAEGNPLFLEEMLTMLADEGLLDEDELDPAAFRVPPTIEALLRARLDQLDGDERAAIGAAAVEGDVFHLGAITRLVPDALRPRVSGLLLDLIRKDFVHPERSMFAGDQGYRFHHGLIRDTAYKATPKRIRAELHELYADWLEQRAGERLAEWNEIVGYHLERAWRYRCELRLEDEHSRQLAARAGACLVAAGHRALALADMRAAAAVVSRALAVLPEDSSERRALLPDFAWALRESGRFDEAQQAVEEALAAGAGADDPGLAARARVERLLTRQLVSPEGWAVETRGEVPQLLETFEQLDDQRGLAQVRSLEADTLWIQCQFGAAGRAYQRALDHARLAHDVHMEAELRMRVQAADVIGPTPVETGARRCEESLALGGSHLKLEAGTLLQLAVFRAMQGRFEEAREQLERAAPRVADLGTMIYFAAAAEMSAWVELLAGDAAAAERRELPGYMLLREHGEKAWLATHAATLARIRAELGRLEEAEELTHESERDAATDDHAANIVWRQVRAKVLAARGDPAAEQLARGAVAIAAKTDALDLRGNALLALGEVLQSGGRLAEADGALREALGVFEQKGNIVSAARSRALLGAPESPLIPSG
jgi:class 3 adenylate cyclase/tetratricopeptide (TPR) repeat protein